MKKIFVFWLLCMTLCIFTACENTPEATEPSATGQPASGTEQSANSEPPGEDASVIETPLDSEASVNSADAVRQISVQFGDNIVIYELNDSPAAISLYEQLPITIEVEDYSTNEKIFYPPQELDTSDSPLAAGGAGTLAYYAPWGDVVMFYDDYNENPSLFELGQVVSGGELVAQMAGTITIDVVE